MAILTSLSAMPSFRIITLTLVFTLCWFGAMAVYFSALPGGVSLDFMFTQRMIFSALETFTPADVQWHIWGTIIGDSVLPLAYGTVTVLAILRYGRGRWKTALLALIMLGVAFDFLENALHMPLLRGDVSGVGVHIMATCAKFACILPPMLYGLINWAREGLRR